MKLIAPSAFWQDVLLKQDSNNCIAHVIVPSIMMSTWLMPETTTEQTADIVQQHACCALCDKSIAGKGIRLAFRIALSKKQTLNGFNYNMNMASAGICMSCVENDQLPRMTGTSFELLKETHRRVSIFVREIPNEIKDKDVGMEDVLSLLNKKFHDTSHLNEYLTCIGKLDGQCSHCLKSGKTKRCSGCAMFRYCDNACQKADWKNHKKQCVAFQKFKLFWL